MDLVKFTFTETGLKKKVACGTQPHVLHPRKSKLSPWLLTALNAVIMLLVLTLP